MPSDHQNDTPARRSRRLPAVAAVVAGALLLGGTAGAVSAAHKAVMLDVDGEITRVTTFAGSVEGLLRGADVELGEHDVVVPAIDAPLRDGAAVVVRLGRELTVESDGAQTTTWVAALDADDALRLLAARGGDVRLVASRSGDRVALPLPVSSDGGDVVVVADGAEHVASYDGDGLDGLLDAAGVTVAADDLVSVEPRATGVAIVVQRVVTEDVTTTTALPFGRVERRDAERFSDLAPRVDRRGVAGERTLVERVTTVDGVETARETVSEDVSDPVDEIVAVGTRARPVAPPPAPVPAAGGSVGDDVWARLAQCESGGRPNVVSASGRFHGLYQFSVPTWQSVGGTGLPSQASPAEQRHRAQLLQARSGWGQWPACARRLGLLG